MVGVSVTREAKPADLDALVRNNIAMAWVSTLSMLRAAEHPECILNYFICYLLFWLYKKYGKVAVIQECCLTLAPAGNRTLKR